MHALHCNVETTVLSIGSMSIVLYIISTCLANKLKGVVLQITLNDPICEFSWCVKQPLWCP